MALFIMKIKIFILILTLHVAFGTLNSFSQQGVIAGGSDHSLALCSNGGSVRSWGNNGYGQLGNGTTTSSNVPVTVSGLTLVTALEGGEQGHSLALKSNGTVWGWGKGNNGQLGDGAQVDRTTPVQVSGLTGITAIAAGFEKSVALKSDNTVWFWGYEQFGEDGRTDPGWIRTTPVQWGGGFTNAIAIATGRSHVLVLKNDNTVWASGYNLYGQLGDGTQSAGSSFQSTFPVQVVGAGGVGFLTGITALASDYYFSMALDNTGQVWTWGYNFYGQLGDGTTNDSWTPVAVSGLTNITAIAAGSSEAYALKNDGTVWAWGANWNGQLGDGTTNPSLTPVQVGGAGFTNVTAIAGGAGHGLARKSDGTLWAWGGNFSGQLGDGTTTARSTPVQVTLCNVGVLPVELLHFNADVENNGIVKCKWSTASELNNDYFSLERSRDGISFEQIGTVQGAGNSSTVLHYEYDDLEPYRMSYYRLKQVDFNGTYEYSKIVSVFFGGIELISFHPDGSQNVIADIEVNESTDAKIEVFNTLGQLVIFKNVRLAKGQTQININVSQITQGIYMFRASLPGKEKTQKMFVR